MQIKILNLRHFSDQLLEEQIDKQFIFKNILCEKKVLGYFLFSKTEKNVVFNNFKTIFKL